MGRYNVEDIDLRKIVPHLWGTDDFQPVRYFEQPPFEYQDFGSWRRYELCRMDWLHGQPFPFVAAIELAVSPYGDQWAVLAPEIEEEDVSGFVLLLAQARFESIGQAARAMVRRVVRVFMSAGYVSEPDCWEQSADCILSIPEIQSVWAEALDAYLSDDPV